MISYNNKFQEMTEDQYQIQNEAQNASLLTTGNGYFGVRGSFEEFGPVGVQGSYIRGLFDEIIEIPDIFVDNIYMRKYYFNELKAKTFEYQDSCINYCDFLLVRFVIGDKIFFPWEGEIKSWIRYIDTSDGSLIREVTWDDGQGNLSKLKYKRFASFNNNHIYVLKCSLEKLNHNLPCKIISGIDTFIKTNGQKKSQSISENLANRNQQYLFSIGQKYNAEVAVNIHNNFINCDEKSIENQYQDGMYYEVANDNGNKNIALEKLIYVSANIDYDEENDLLQIGNNELSEMRKIGYDKLYQDHLLAYKKAFDIINIQIEGNDKDDALLRYVNYQTLIAVDRFDEVHSLSAKNLTAEKYNQFVWWDSEIYQLPIYIATSPEAAKKALIYRYNRLEQSKRNAEKEGLKGAKYAFCSSVLGDEKVWEYARHPFLQIHINSDVAYGVINYFKNTNDKNFMKEYGLKLLAEIARYWLSRVSYIKKIDQYHILNVTGTDEHHPYVDNNAYTNYETAYILKQTYKLLKEFKSEILNEDELRELKDVYTKLYLPLQEDGLIPQFDGYFDLKKELPIEGKGAGLGFQMKESGLYHLSQIIKQPDVMMLFSYLNILEKNYQINWEYYEKMCEISSSLTYPVHAICAIDNNEYDKFYKYWQEAMRIDIDDLHNGAHQGLHGGCMAGGYYGIYRGLFGIKANYDYLEINPKKLTFADKITLKFSYQNTLYQAMLTNDELVIISDTQAKIMFQGNKINHKKKTTIELKEG